MKNFKKVLTMAGSLVLTAAIAVGATVAYLQYDDSDVNVMTLGNVKIEQIELQRKDGVDYKNGGEIASGDELEAFKQGQLLFPSTYSNLSDYSAKNPNAEQFWWGDYVTADVSGNGSSNGLWDDKLTGAMDKFVFVKNTGKSDAYYRTIIAFECPEGMEYSEGSDKEFMMNINGNARFDWDEIGYTTIDNVRYLIMVATYNKVLEPGTISRPSLLQVVMTHNATNEDMEKLGGAYDILVLSQAVQTAGFDSAAQALDTAFGKANVANVTTWFGGKLNSTAAATDAQFKDALTADKETIVVSLDKDVTYDVAAWQDNAMGGASTKNIMILGNGHTITFNQKDSDWNNIAAGDAALSIYDAKITSSGYNDGPWNRHDINFACDVELINVVSDKALAFKAGATLKNVTINDANTSDTYAIWIQPNGQTVDIDGLTIDMIACSDGRGIKIDEQYVSDPQKVTLNVKNATFKTEEKSAILVKSKKGADINLENIDIYGVKADPINAVWVDEASAASADLVTVTGGKKIVEGDVEVVVADTKNEIKAALQNGADVINANGANIGDLNYGLNTTTVPAGTTVTIANAVVEGKSYGNAVAGTVVFENCTFTNTGAYSIHFDAGSGNVVFNNCTLSGWCSFGSAIKSVEMNNCTINGNGKYALVRCYQNTTLTNCTIDSSNTDTTDVYQDGLDITAGYTMTLIDCTNVNGNVSDLFSEGDITGTDGTVIIK